MRPSIGSQRATGPLHVVQVVFSLDIGGQERVVLDLARGLIARGHRATVISLSEGGALRDRFEGIPVETVIANGEGVSLSAPLRLAAAFRRLRPDIVHTHNRTPLIYGAIAARIAGVPRLVHTKHNARDGGRAVRVLSHLYDYYIAVSDDTARVSRDVEHVPRQLVEVIANGIDVREYRHDGIARARIRAELGIPGGACVIGTVGRLVPDKNYGLLVEAARGVLDEDTHLVIVGDGPERAALQNEVDPAIRSFVHFIGARSDIHAVLSAFDIFALSSHTEGMPMAVIEAMAARLPILATAVGGVPKVVRDGATGFLVPDGNVATYHDTLAALVRDRRLQIALGAAARRDAHSRFSLERVVDEYLGIYA